MKDGRPLSDLFNKELQNCVLDFACLAEVKHSLMGRFPIINKKTEEPIIFDSEETARKVAKALKDHKPKFNKILSLIDKESKRAFDLTGIDNYVLEMRKDMQFISAEDLKSIDIEKELRWAPGIF